MLKKAMANAPIHNATGDTNCTHTGHSQSFPDVKQISLLTVFQGETSPEWQAFGANALEVLGPWEWAFPRSESQL